MVFVSSILMLLKNLFITLAPWSLHLFAFDIPRDAELKLSGCLKDVIWPKNVQSDYFTLHKFVLDSGSIVSSFICFCRARGCSLCTCLASCRPSRSSSRSSRSTRPTWCPETSWARSWWSSSCRRLPRSRGRRSGLQLVGLIISVKAVRTCLLWINALQ